MNRILSSIVLVLFVTCIHPARAGTSLSPADSLLPEKPEPFALTEINFEAGRIEKYFKKLDSGVKPDARFVEIQSDFAFYKRLLQNEALDFKSYNPYNLSKFFLENAYRLWEGFYLRMSDWETEVNARLRSVQEEINELDQITARWEFTLSQEEMNDEPDEIKERVRQVLSKAQDYRRQLGKLKRQIINLEDDISEMSVFCTNMIAEIAQLQQNQRDSLFIAVASPFWDITVSPTDYIPVGTRLNKFWYENTKILKNYFQMKNLGLFLVWIFLIALIFLLLRRSYLRKKFDDNLPGHHQILRIFADHPVISLLSLFLVGFHLFFPYYPLVLNHILTLILLMNMRYILSNFIDRHDKQFILKLIILLLANDLEIIFWYFGNVARYYILLESILGLVLTWNYMRPEFWRQFSAKSHVKKSKWILALFIFVFYFIAFVSNLLGHLDLAVLAAKVGIHVPEFTVVLYGVYLITISLIRSIVRIGQSREKGLLKNYWEIIEKKGIQISGILAGLYWIYSLTVSLEVSRVIYNSTAEFLVTEQTIGTMKVTAGSILAMILILLGTFFITRLLKLMIEPVFQRHTRLPRGIPAAISVTIRYFLILLGFIFALSAAGIELGKFSLIAGALGVGIGFGLQNIVNNFISGLILVYERPLQVGDTIEVDNLLGQVNRIGIRASQVKTYDGAEVMVPNGNLISNQLINWTLSDNRRRIEIKIGVSYGSDPNVVLKLLEKVAHEHEDVLKDPAPWALFDDFGSSSLNFRLLFWVPYDIGLRTKSDVALGIYNIFSEHGIEIPFPQLDLHVKDGEKKKNDN